MSRDVRGSERGNAASSCGCGCVWGGNLRSFVGFAALGGSRLERVQDPGGIRRDGACDPSRDGYLDIVAVAIRYG